MGEPNAMSKLLNSMQDLFDNQPLAAGGDIARQTRDQAMKEFVGLGLPAANDEHWKYTRLRSLSGQGFSLATTVDQAIDVASVAGDDAIRIVFVNGIYAPALSDAAEFEDNGIRLLSTALDADPGVAGGFLPIPDPAVHRFASLNRAFLGQGVVVELRTGRRIEKPIVFVHYSSEAEQTLVSHPRIMVRAGRRSEATIVEHYTGDDEQGNFCNALTELDLDEGARLNHYRVQNEGDNAFHIGSVFARLKNNSRLHSLNLSLGGKLARVDMQTELLGEGAELVMDGLYLGKSRQHLDNNTLVQHRVPGTRSAQDYRGIVTDRARAVFTGKGVVHQDAQKTDATQSNRNLILSDGAEIDARPVLEIYADDVKCSHGATIGQLDKDALFYLQSRGLSSPEAKSLLTFAFAEDVILRIGNDAIRENMERYLAQWLPELSNADELVSS